MVAKDLHSPVQFMLLQCTHTHNLFFHTFLRCCCQYFCFAVLYLCFVSVNPQTPGILLRCMVLYVSVVFSSMRFHIETAERVKQVMKYNRNLNRQHSNSLLSLSVQLDRFGLFSDKHLASFIEQNGFIFPLLCEAAH